MAKGLQANNEEGFKGFVGVHDLNFNLNIWDALGFEQPGVTHERGQDSVCASHGVRAMTDVWSNHRSPWRRCRCSHFELRRFVSRNSLCATDLARVPARHRSLSDCQPGQVVSYGDEGRTSAFYAVRCVEPSRLAHLSRTGHAIDSACPKSLCQRLVEHRRGCHRIRAGRNHPRPQYRELKIK